MVKNGVKNMAKKAKSLKNRHLNRFDDEWMSTWLRSPHRKPLVLRGARQVGKSFLVRELALREQRELCELNFEAKPKLKSLFDSVAPEGILNALEQEIGTRFNDKTLLFLDEIQDCPAALSSLRYFYEKNPEIPVVAAGSLLEFALNESPYSMPVGRVTFRWIHPFRFQEFLAVRSKKLLLEVIENFVDKGVAITPPAHDALMRELAIYCFVGGMPEAVRRFHHEGDTVDGVFSAATTHDDIILSYRADFAKYRRRIPLESLHAVFDALPQIVGDVRTKFGNIDKSQRSDPLRKAVTALELAGVIRRVTLTHATALPISAQEDLSVFKLIPLDVGIFCSQTFTGANVARPTNNLFEKWTQGTVFEKQWLGQITEVLIGQSLAAQTQAQQRLHYWLRDGKSTNAEVDYVAQFGTSVIPIEVKAGASGSLRSLHVFMAEKKLTLAVRFDLNLPSSQQIDVSVPIAASQQGRASYQLCNLPLYLADWLPRIVTSKCLNP
jgi:predicted AAA+ superfamily ATPase